MRTELLRFNSTVERAPAFEAWMKSYGVYIIGYVVMPEHLHLLMTEPERSTLSVVLQLLKRIVAHRLSGGAAAWC